MKFVLACLLMSLWAVASHAQWVKQNVNTTASLRGLSVVNEKVVWASGTGGTVIRTIDGGKTWNVIIVPAAEKLDFRDIEAFDANTAYILSIGNGESSRIYKTTDGGKNWEMQFKNTNEKAFFDAIACWDRNACFAVSDPVDGHFLSIFTINGEKWQTMPRMPSAKSGEAAFAASGTCLIAFGDRFNASVVTGGSDARVFRTIPTIDDGRHWQASDTQFTKGTSGSGIFSIAMFDDQNGAIVGGNYEKPEEHENNLAITNDGGKTWKMGTGLSGYRSGVTYVDRKTIVAVGTNGSDISRDDARTWERLDGENYNSVQAKGKKAVWAVGPKGMVAKLK